MDYDPDTGSVIVVTDRMVRKGYEITVADGRPNAEMLLACGTVEAPNPADYLDWNVSLVAADRCGFLAVSQMPAALQMRQHLAKSAARTSPWSDSLTQDVLHEEADRGGAGLRGGADVPRV